MSKIIVSDSSNRVNLYDQRQRLRPWHSSGVAAVIINAQ